MIVEEQIKLARKNRQTEAIANAVNTILQLTDDKELNDVIELLRCSRKAIDIDLDDFFGHEKGGKR